MKYMFIKLGGVCGIFLALALGGLQAGQGNVVIPLADGAAIGNRTVVEIHEGELSAQGETLPAVTILFSRAESSFSEAVIFPLEHALSEFSTLSFWLEMDSTGGNLDEVRFGFLNERKWYLTKGHLNTVFKLEKYLSETQGNLVKVSLPLQELAESFDLAEVRFFMLNYGVQQIPEGETVKVTVSEVTLE